MTKEAPSPKSELVFRWSGVSAFGFPSFAVLLRRTGRFSFGFKFKAHRKISPPANTPVGLLIPALGFFRHYGRKAPWGHAPLRGLGISHSTERHGLVIPVSGSSECGRTFYHWHRCCSLPTSFRPNPSFPCILEDCSIPRTGRAKASTGPSRAMRSSPAIE